MTTDTIYLAATSNATTTCRYRVLREDYSKEPRRSMRARKDVQGRPTVTAAGFVRALYQFTILITDTQESASDGTLQSLLSLYQTNTGFLYFTPPTGSQIRVEPVGEIQPQHLTPILSGSGSYYLIPITLAEVV